MTDTTHDTLTDLALGTPALFTLAARSLPPLVGVQFLLAGGALFSGLPWAMHGMLGGIIGLPVVVLAGYALALPRLRGFGWWAAALVILYVGQLALASSGAALLAFHPFNAALFLTASLVLLFKVERRRAARTGA